MSRARALLPTPSALRAGSVFRAGSALLAGALLLAGCGRSPAAVAATGGEAGLRRNLLRAARLEVVVAEGLARQRAEAAAALLEREGVFAVHLAFPGERPWPRAARTVLATPATQGLAPLLAALGVTLPGRDGAAEEVPPGEGDAAEGAREEAADERAPGAPEPRGFEVLGRRFALGDHALVATFADPERPGLPVTLYLATEPDALAALVADLTPAVAPHLAVLRGGRPVLACALAPSGRALLGTLADGTAAERRVRGRYATRPVPIEGLTLRTDVDPGATAIALYVEDLRAARAGVERWLEPEGARVDLVAHGTVEAQAALGGADGLSRVEPATNVVHALVADDLPTDAGAGYAAALARAALGEPAAAWLEVGAGRDAAPRFWRFGLEPWCAWLAAGGLATDVATLVDPLAAERRSPLVVEPLRGLLFRHLRETLAPDELAALWRGVATLAVSPELEADFAARLAALARHYGPALERNRAARLAPHRPGGDAAWPVGGWRGIALAGLFDAAPPASAPDPRYAPAATVGEARALGATALLVPTFGVVEPGLPARASVDRASRIRPLGGDLALLAVLDAARREGLATVLVPHLLWTRSGPFAGRLLWGDRERWEAFFDAYERWIVHWGLLGELCGVDVLALGSSLSEAARTGDEDDAELAEWKRAGWHGVVRAARNAFAGGLAYFAVWPDEAYHIELWREVDYLGAELFGPLRDPDHGGRPADGIARASLRSRLADVLALAAQCERPALVSTGFTATERAWRDGAQGGGARDPYEQARLVAQLGLAVEELAAARGAAPEGALAGVFLWSLALDPSTARADDRGFELRTEPTAEALRRWFRGE